jgi:unsaturated rhamnogalacturonyl hydrolase
MSPRILPTSPKQFSLIEEHGLSQQTGLLYHGWDESRTQAWADKVTGTSHVFWSRGMGWYLMALVDTLPCYSKDDPNRAILLAILNRTAAAIVRYQDKSNRTLGSGPRQGGSAAQLL